MAKGRTIDLDAREDRLTGPRRVGLFGHRNVGKTTLLAMIYRQASAGEVAGLRLAAGDPASAEYLAEMVRQAVGTSKSDESPSRSAQKKGGSRAAPSIRYASAHSH